MKLQLKLTEADTLIDKCLSENRCFHVIAGAGSGKTASLIRTLESIRDQKGALLRRTGQKVVCLTFTKRAVEVVRQRLRWDDLFVVSTLHSFLWGEISRFSKDIQKTLYDEVLPSQIAHAREQDDGKTTKKATEARQKAEKLVSNREALLRVPAFRYADGSYSDFANGELGHDDVITVAASLIRSHDLLRRLIGQKYPYILVDEAQDTHEEIVSALNLVCINAGLPLVGYFGDPMQQIYDKRAGSFQGPPGSLLITKEENFRSSNAVVNFLNAFRTDLRQFPAGDNKDKEGSVKIRCIQTEEPELPRKRYSPNQLFRATALLDKAVVEWGWEGKKDVKHLYLVRQMIARRLGFMNLHGLFDGDYASQKAKEEFETGDHFLIKPFVSCFYPLLVAFRAKDSRKQIDILRQHAPAFDTGGVNAKRSLADMMKHAFECTIKLNEIWASGTAGDMLRYAVEAGLTTKSERLGKNLSRQPRIEIYEEAQHGVDRQDWLVDSLLGFRLAEVEKYCEFITENTIYSTQHGVKGEEYDKVLVVFDDIGLAWSQYSFSGLLTPKAFGKDPTERQLRLSKNLAYVCFSRAVVDLRIVYFTPNVAAAGRELADRGLFTDSQIELV
ncbi:MAG: UvrD-helicase domain-containing protein [Verrucomicrobiia bacterium]